jgi:hypothetical protein
MEQGGRGWREWEQRARRPWESWAPWGASTALKKNGARAMEAAGTGDPLLACRGRAHGEESREH